MPALSPCATKGPLTGHGIKAKPPCIARPPCRAGDLAAVGARFRGKRHMTTIKRTAQPLDRHPAVWQGTATLYAFMNDSKGRKAHLRRQGLSKVPSGGYRRHSVMPTRSPATEGTSHRKGLARWGAFHFGPDGSRWFNWAKLLCSIPRYPAKPLVFMEITLPPPIIGVS